MLIHQQNVTLTSNSCSFSFFILSSSKWFDIPHPASVDDAIKVKLNRFHPEGKIAFRKQNESKFWIKNQNQCIWFYIEYLRQFRSTIVGWNQDCLAYSFNEFILCVSDKHICFWLPQCVNETFNWIISDRRKKKDLMSRFKVIRLMRALNCNFKLLCVSRVQVICKRSAWIP